MIGQEYLAPGRFVDSDSPRVIAFARAAGTAAKDATDAMEWAGRLSNALIDEQLRVSIAAETRAVRELIYRQAFAEADFKEDAS